MGGGGAGRGPHHVPCFPPSCCRSVRSVWELGVSRDTRKGACSVPGCLTGHLCPAYVTDYCRIKGFCALVFVLVWSAFAVRPARSVQVAQKKKKTCCVTVFGAGRSRFLNDSGCTYVCVQRPRGKCTVSCVMLLFEEDDVTATRADVAEAPVLTALGIQARGSKQTQNRPSELASLHCFV